jgi:F-type H+-transporting ATPase subunit a
MLFAANAFDHVMDSFHIHLFETLHWEIPLPHFKIGATEFGITKYTVLMFLAAIIICGIYLPLAKKISTGEAPKGTWWNLFESILTFIRDEVAKPYIGKEADKYVPYLWTVFLFVLTCNLLGMFPFMGSPTASFTVTAVLAFFSYVFINGASIVRFGLKAHLFSFAPHMDMPLIMKVFMIMMLWPIEFVGLIIKCFVLAVRLFANMFAGHMVLATILLFIPAVAGSGPGLEGAVTIGSVLGVLALSMLELFVAFLQAYLFVFLTALFLGGVLEHAEHSAHGHEHEHAHDEHHIADAGEEDVHRKPIEHAH